MKIFWYIVMLSVLVSCSNIESNIDISSDDSVVWTGEIVIDSIDILEVEAVENIDEFADWSGEYYSEDNKMLELLGPNEIGGVDADFSYDDITCVGLWLLANLEKSGVANYYSDTTACQINFTYNPGIVEVNSYGCGDYEDSKCGSFTGIYKLR